MSSGLETFQLTVCWKAMQKGKPRANTLDGLICGDVLFVL